ncbi:MAG: nodulation protein NfeD, partial [Deltaproteobacteria bacterium]|nr:nodulation protein NfeD [Deltaproteobacteria bacterium]
MHRRNVVFSLLVWLVILSVWSAFSQDTGPRTAVVLEIKGAIGPAVSDYFERSLEKAEESDAAIVILQMDTPGGFDHSMRDIIKSILSSSIPVVSYVAPGGSRAASAGT